MSWKIRFLILAIVCAVETIANVCCISALEEKEREIVRLKKASRRRMARDFLRDRKRVELEEQVSI